MKPTAFLAHWFESQPAPWRLGEVLIRPGYELRHGADVEEVELKELCDGVELRDMLKTDAAGNFRPVRGATNLRRGWKFLAPTLTDLVRALQYIYPAAIASAAAEQAGHLRVTEFHETAQRQTGMYRITQIITDEQLHEVVEKICVRGCLRQRLWAPKSARENQPSLLPVLCPEACNYFVGKARARIKGEDKE